MTLALKYAKALVPFLIVVIGGGIAQGLINGAAAAWLTIILGAVSTGGVYAARNTTSPSDGGYIDGGGLVLLLIGFLLGVLSVKAGLL